MTITPIPATSNTNRFQRYGKAFATVSLAELANHDGTLARVEESGSEGFYVEVARWDAAADQWARYAFLKVFDSTTAQALADQINANSAQLPVFSRLPNHSDIHRHAH
ncbi:MAG: hypothetical protein AWU57_475 [Marinobacter sp. T13-3]|nr:MAG: hypothetical protein AWU57_475 [Marinobacter sp. T13-3]